MPVRLRHLGSCQGHALASCLGRIERRVKSSLKRLWPLQSPLAMVDLGTWGGRLPLRWEFRYYPANMAGLWGEAFYMEKKGKDSLHGNLSSSKQGSKKHPQPRPFLSPAPKAPALACLRLYLRRGTISSLLNHCTAADNKRNNKMSHSKLPTLSTRSRSF